MRSHKLDSSCRIEALETRRLLSMTTPGDFILPDPIGAAAKRPGGAPSGPAIRLDLVALHEFGHSLGLTHDYGTDSIMYPYYNPNYDLNNFANDPAAKDFAEMYSGDLTKTAWNDSDDPDPRNGTVEITYSFILDGARLDNGKTSTLFSTFDNRFDAGAWEHIFTDALNLWASVTQNRVSFVPFEPDGIENSAYAFNTAGLVQNDPNFGDIRIGAHRFDGAGRTLAHTYYPPPNGVTAAGDAHFDNAENWVLPPSATGGNTLTAAGATLGSSAAPALAAAQQLPFATSGEIGAKDDLLSDDALVLA